MTQGSRGPADLSALSPWVNELAQTFVSLSSDIAFVLDAGGVITNVAQAGGEAIAPGASQWVGRRLSDTVTLDTRRKIELLLADVSSTGLARRREVSHPADGGAAIPVAYTAIRLGAAGPVLAVGRDLRAIAAIQQRFIEAQQELERGYWKARQAETRERLLLQVATDAVLVLDGPSGEIIVANAAALQRAGASAESVHGRRAALLFDEHSRGPVEELLHTARSGGRPVELRARLAGASGFDSVLATPFRSGEQQRLLLRLRAAGPQATRPLPALGEAVAIADAGGRLRSCDAGFVALLGAPDEPALVGRPLSDWFGQVGAEIDALLAEVRRDGLAGASAMRLRRIEGGEATVALSATWLTEGDQEAIGLIARRSEAAPDAPAEAQRAFAAAWAALDGQLGNATLPEMLREASALAERHFIQMALQRAGGDAAVAAQLLGVSADSLRRGPQRDGAT